MAPARCAAPRGGARDAPGLCGGGARAYGRRERPAGAALVFRRGGARERFAGFAPRAELDTHDPDASVAKLSFLRKRSKIVEIVGAKDLLFGLTLSGVCAVFDRATRRRLCFVNTSPDEVVRSLFYNEANESLISVSVFRADNFSSLKCRTTPLDCIRAREPARGVSLFENECLKWPGFVEFDDVNGKVITHCAADKVYKLWTMANYDLLYSVLEPQLHELKVAPNVLFLVFTRTTTELPLKVLCIEDGRPLLELTQPLLPDVPVELVEFFGSKLLVKQAGEPLRITDVRTGEQRAIAADALGAPSGFIYLFEMERFLTFGHGQVHAWDFDGRLVTHFEDHTLWHADCSTNNIFISSGQQLLISHCRSPTDESGRSPTDENGRSPTDDGGPSSGGGGGSGASSVPPPAAPCAPAAAPAVAPAAAVAGGAGGGRGARHGCINVSSIGTGGNLARIAARGELQDVTALWYNEDAGELYVGNTHGTIQLWASA
ncbi:hypothetical protein KFE25_012639 [Diacronema lutheri]|uniref:Uncharacterized protein n=2 Tax=Diacronema lutheri TaxID=2081491 RepID=A0A8J5X2U8_DIALT|nr:hypothetical protein KFE25_012639 [Diacronema lutheri]